MAKTFPDSMWRMHIAKGSDATDPDLAYLMYPIASGELDLEKPAMNMALPGQSYNENPLLGIEGQSGSVPISFAIWNDGRDRSLGSLSSTSVGEDTSGEVITVRDQIRYWTKHDYGSDDFFFDPDFSVKYKITIYKEENGSDYHDDSDFPEATVFNGDDLHAIHMQSCVITKVFIPALEAGVYNFIKGCSLEISLGTPY